MSEVALTNIVYGLEDGTRVEFEAGDIVDLDEDVMETLRANGAVGEPPAAVSAVIDQLEAKDARIAELEAALAEAQGS